MKKEQYIHIISFTLISLPAIAFAKGLVPCGGAGEPACDFSQFAILVNNLINWFIGISVSVAAITFAIAGGKMLFNPGNEQKWSEAKEMFKKTLTGLIIVLVAWLVVHTVISTLVKSSTGALRFFK